MRPLLRSHGAALRVEGPFEHGAEESKEVCQVAEREMLTGIVM